VWTPKGEEKIVVCHREEGQAPRKNTLSVSTRLREKSGPGCTRRPLQSLYRHKKTCSSFSWRQASEGKGPDTLFLFVFEGKGGGRKSRSFPWKTRERYVSSDKKKQTTMKGHGEGRQFRPFPGGGSTQKTREKRKGRVSPT